MQILEGEHDRLRPRARHHPIGQRRQLPAAQFLGREFRRRVPPAAECRAAARASGTYSAGSSLISASVFSRSASRRSAGTSAPPKRCRPHSAIGCSGVFCRSCEQLHSTQVCGVSLEPSVKLLDQARFAEARLADDQHELALALPRPLPAPHQHRNFLVAADERRQLALPGAPAAAARAHDPEQRHRLGHALELMRAALLGDEQAGDLALHPAP